MKNQLPTIAIVAAMLGLIGCGKSAEKPNPVSTFKLSGLEYLPLEREKLLISNEAVAGTGSMIFRLPRPKDNNYKVTFSLDKGSSVTLVTNADTKLAGGANLVFGRTATDKLTVYVTTGNMVCTPGDLKCDLSADFAGVNAAAPITLDFDVHEHGHVVHFENGLEKNEYAIDRVAGTFFGLKLNNAIVTNVAVAGPALPH